MLGNTFTIIRTLYDILRPTFDLVRDWDFARGALVTHHPGVAFLMILPVLFNLALNLYKWSSTDYDTKKEKQFTWVLVILGLWPQYQMFKLLWLILRGESNDIWKPLQDKIKKEISDIERFIETIPQFFVSIFVFSLFVARSGDTQDYFGVFKILSNVWKKNDTTITDIFGSDSILGINNNIWFPISCLMSALSGTRRIIVYMYSGPIRITSNTKRGKVVVSSSMAIYVITSFLGRFFISYNLARFTVGPNGPNGNSPLSHGIWAFLLIFSILIAFPALIAIGPLARVLGLKKFTKMILRHPELLVVLLITEYALEPIEGRNRYGSCCRCCNCWRFCTWTCCCHECTPVKTNQLIISKEMSWSKMLYLQLVGYSFLYIYLVYDLLCSERISDCWECSLTLLILLSLGIICFGITLHHGESKGVLSIESVADTTCIETVPLERKLQKNAANELLAGEEITSSFLVSQNEELNLIRTKNNRFTASKLKNQNE